MSTAKLLARSRALLTELTDIINTLTERHGYEKVNVHLDIKLADVDGMLQRNAYSVQAKFRIP